MGSQQRRAAAMRIEALSQGKNPARQDLNEDALVILPGRAYAAIDGATDRSGLRYEDGRSSGQMAAAAVAAAVTDLFGGRQPPLPFDPTSVVGTMTAAIAAEYRRLDITDLAVADRNRRFNATLALAAFDGPALHLLLVGDSGIRINGSVLHQNAKLLDRVTAQLRAAAWRRLLPRDVPSDRRDTIAFKVAFCGTRHAADAVLPYLEEMDLVAIEAETLEEYCSRHPEIPAAEFETLIQGGILFGQSRYQNDETKALGYSCLDGFAVPICLARHVALPAEKVRTIELFTDGYFDPGEEVSVAAWERSYERIEREDPAKICRYPSVKGSGPDGQAADDRSVICVHLS